MLEEARARQRDLAGELASGIVEVIDVVAELDPMLGRIARDAFA